MAITVWSSGEELDFYFGERRLAWRWSRYHQQFVNWSDLATALELKELAIERLKEAECLFNAGHCYGAFYIGGYAVELALKAYTCKTLDVDIFDKATVPANIARGFMIHNISDLIFLSGLTRQLKAFSSGNDEFSEAWSVVTNWSEQRRYELECNPVEAGKFIASVKTVMQWLQKIW